MKLKSTYNLLLFFTLCVSCQTFQPVEYVYAPAIFKEHASTYCKKEGAFSLFYTKDDKKTSQARFDWVSEETCEMDMELSNEFGYAILRAHLDKNGFTDNKLNDIKISEKGFFIVKGKEIGLRWSELPLLLSFEIPRDWLDRLQQSEPRSSLYFVNDKERQIQLQALDALRYKITYKWSSLWFLKDHTISFDFDHKIRKILITLPDESVFTLQGILDEQ